MTGACGMTIVLIIAVFVITDFMVVGAIVPAMVGSMWGPIPTRYPPVEPAPDAVRKEFQSFRAEMVNLGWCVHVAVDSGYLHLRPAWLGRLFRVRPASVPWDAIEFVSTRGNVAKVKVAGVFLKGPTWCLELADREGRNAAPRP